MHVSVKLPSDTTNTYVVAALHDQSDSGWGGGSKGEKGVDVQQVLALEVRMCACAVAVGVVINHGNNIRLKILIYFDEDCLEKSKRTNKRQQVCMCVFFGDRTRKSEKERGGKKERAGESEREKVSKKERVDLR